MHRRRYSSFCLVLILCMSIVACGSLFKDYGRITASNEVTNAFEAYQVNPQYRYYISGPHINPNAIMGLNRDYRLDPSTTWMEVDMTPAMLKDLIWGMKVRVFGYQAGLYGFEISDNSGRPIGVWYSILEALTFVKINSDGTVRIDTPPLETYEDEGDGSMGHHNMHINRH